MFNSETARQFVWSIILITVFIGLSYLSPERKGGSRLSDNIITATEQDGIQLYQLAVMYDYEGDKDKAKSHFLMAIAALPQGDERIFNSYIYLARLVFPADQHLSEQNKEELTGYIKKLDSLKQTNTDKAWVHALLAEFYHSENNQEYAIESARKAVELDPSNAAFPHVLGEVMLEGHNHGKHVFYTNHLDEAIYFLKLSLEIDKIPSHSYYLLGVAYWFKGEREKAKAIWQEGLRVIPIDTSYPKWFKVEVEKDIRAALAAPEELEHMKL